MRITKAQLTAHVAADDDSRPVLAGIHFSPDGVSASADGYKLLTVPKDTVGARYVEQDAIEVAPLADEVIMHAVDAQRLAKMTPKDGEVFLTRGVGGQVHATVIGPGVGSTTTPVKTIEGRYPDFTKIVPAKEDAVYEIAVDAEKLIDLLKQMVAVADERQPRRKSRYGPSAMRPVVLRFRDNDEGFRVDSVDVPDLVGVLMPYFHETILKRITARAMRERTDLVQA